MSNQGECHTEDTGKVKCSVNNFVSITLKGLLFSFNLVSSPKASYCSES